MKFMRFRGGIHPPDYKALTANAVIETLPPPETAVVPLVQHLGVPADACVARGDEVTRGQKIGTARGFVSANVHAPISGKVTAVGAVSLPGGGSGNAVTIASDGNDTPCPTCTPPDTSTQEGIIAALTEAGIVGLGGATFPSHVKLQPPADASISLLIVNGAECEPFLTCDDRLMRENPTSVVRGAAFVMRALGISHCIIAIEDNKKDAYTAMCAAAEDEDAIEVVSVHTRYPQGGEKQLIYALTGREVPSGGLPMHVGCVVHNVATLASVADACTTGMPLIERIVTVSGDAVARPGNFRVRIGTPLRALLDAAQCDYESCAKIVLGGPMTGKAEANIDVPVVKGTSGILTFTSAWVDTRAPSPCIRCGRCVSVCPVGLAPTTLESVAMALDTDAMKTWHAMDCIECGSCAYTCPARRPLVHALRYAKAQIIALQKAKKN